MRVACLTRYGSLGASSRVRFLQYFEPLRGVAPDLTLEHHGLLDNEYLRRKYTGAPVLARTLRCYVRRALGAGLRPPPDLWWVEKELWPWVPAAAELALLSRRPFALDLDDAIFHQYDLNPWAAVRRLWGQKIDRLMAAAALVTAGNEYLAGRARAAGARHVELLPTVVDLDRYASPSLPRRSDPALPLIVGWIGSPATVHYLRLVAEPLRQLARSQPVRLHVIGGGDPRLEGIDTEVVPWSEAGEVAAISACDIGIMPLADTPWERGKCGYKLIQYMACGLPVVASPVGANLDIVRLGENGLLAADDAQWLDALRALAADPDLRERLGRHGRELVAQRYSLQAMTPRLAAFLHCAASNSGPEPR